MHAHVLLAPAVLFLLIPKLMLTTYMNEFLWASFGIKATAAMLIQDLALVLVVLGLLAAVLCRPTLLRLCLGYVAVAGLLAFLLIDARVRQIWLQPLSVDLVRYSWKFAPDLASGVDMFFKFPSGLDASFRKWLVYVMFAHFACFGAGAIGLRYLARRSKARGRFRARHYAGATAALAVMTAGAGALVPSHMYSAEKNVVVHSVLSALSSAMRPGAADRMAGIACDQQLRAPEMPATRPADSPSPKPFGNLVLFMLESARWKDLNLDGSGPTVAPALARLAREGMLYKCYVSVPHSSKALFATLTGWHASSGVEILEGMRLRTPSVFWSLREQRHARTYCLSVQNLLFENTNGILMGCGIETRLGPHELRRLAGVVKHRGSSFGDTDELLIDAPARIIRADQGPFAAVILTLAAHHPYDYPDKPAGASAGVEHYWKSIAYLDTVVERILDGMLAAGLLQNTLVVMVGDHGQSFGEHGSYIHNNSMYEEEIAVPLIFWSPDRRLASTTVGVARQIDIAPTIADLMDIHDPKHVRQGAGLLAPDRDRTVYVSSFFDQASMALIDGDDKFIWFPAEDRLLRFDLSADPDEMQALPVDEPTAGDVRHRLASFARYQKSALR